MRIHRRIASLLGALAVAVPAAALAQTQTAAPSKAEFPKRGWAVDFSPTVGVSPGLGKPTAGTGLSAAVTLVRTNVIDEFRHRCVGLTVVMSGVWPREDGGQIERREVAVLTGPRWDVQDPDGTGFARIVAGPWRRSGRNSSQGRSEVTSFAIGVGFGVEVLGFLMDMNWLASPWAEDSPHRLTFSFGHTFSWGLSSR